MPATPEDLRAALEPAMASPADLAPCPVCGDRTNHAHRPAAQISCDAASYTRAAAVTWLAKTTRMDPQQAAPTITGLSRAVGAINAIRVLEVLLAAGWLAPYREAE